MAHAKISASRIERAYLCPASTRLEAEYPDTTNKAAERGTAIHNLAEKMLTHLPYEEAETFFDGEHILPVAQEYVGFIEELKQVGDFHIEVDLTPALSTLHPDLGGTADAVIVSNGKMLVIDLKTGRVPVTAKKNMQLMTYAVGALETFGWKGINEVETLIFQPELGISHEVVSMEELFEFKRLLPKIAEQANDPFAQTVAGNKQCKYCKAKLTCPALKQKADEVAKGEFKSNDINELLDTAELVATWAETIKEDAKSRLLAGEIINGWEMKKGRKMVKWANKTAAEAHFAGNHLYFEIKTPAAIKKLNLDLPQDLLVEEVSAPSLSRTKPDLG